MQFEQIYCVVTLILILDILLLLSYINDIHYAVEHFLVHHFADDTDEKKNIRQTIQDFKSVTNFVNGNNIFLNINKT